MQWDMKNFSFCENETWVYGYSCVEFAAHIQIKTIRKPIRMCT